MMHAGVGLNGQEHLQEAVSHKKIAIIQSNYIPWKGYFDLIDSVDEFVIYDDVQYTRNDWRNRNQIKTPQGLQWLTVPVKTTGRFKQAIWQAEIEDNSGLWRKKHWKAFELYYRKARFYNEVENVFKPLYLENKYETLSELNLAFINAVCLFVGISTKITDSRSLDLIEGKTERLVNICTQLGGDTYLSGPSAENYLDESAFHKSGISVAYFDYSGYPVYPQLWDGFFHNVSIMDMLFHCGRDAMNFIRRR